MKHTNNCDTFLNYLFPSVLGGLFMCLPIIANKYSGLDGVIPVFFTSILCSIILICLFFAKGFKNIALKINIVDICFSLYIFCGIFRMGISKEIFDPMIVCEWFGLVTIYVIVRLLDQKFISILYMSLLAGGIIQAVIGILQFFNILESNNLVFRVTGSFSNPGHLGGLLALSLTIGYSLWRKQKYTWKSKNIILPCVLVVQTITLVLSNSRAAWFAVVVPLFFLCYSRASFKNIFFKLLPCLLVIILLVSLYYYKKESADVRVLTWRSSLLMLHDKPIWGHGIGSFAANYMPYQAQFLDGYPEGEYPLIADNNIIAFNEFIHLGCEQGFVGAIIFLGLLLVALTTRDESYHSQIARSGLICLCVFAMFSYPSSIFPIKVCFPLFVGILGRFRKALIRNVIKNVVILLIVGGIVPGIIFNIQIYRMYRDAYTSVLNGDHIHDSFMDYSGMMHNKNFLYLLSEQYLKHDQIDKSLQVKKRLLDIAPTSSLLCDMGMMYLYKNELDSANNCFLIAKRMTPNHMTPVYGLWLISKAKGDREQCLMLSEKIISLPIRVVNNVVLKARKDARDYIHQQTANQ